MKRKFFRFQAAAVFFAVVLFTAGCDKGSSVADGYYDDYENPDNGNGNDDGTPDIPATSDYETLIVGIWGFAYFSYQIIDTDPTDGEDFTEFIEETVPVGQEDVVGFDGNGIYYEEDYSSGDLIPAGTYSIVDDMLYLRYDGEPGYYANQISFEGDDYVLCTQTGEEKGYSYVVRQGLGRIDYKVR